jgi:hypothetical protein
MRLRRFEGGDGANGAKRFMCRLCLPVSSMLHEVFDWDGKAHVSTEPSESNKAKDMR